MTATPVAPAAPKKKRRIWPKRLLALTISVVVGLGMAEIAARMFQLAPPAYPETDTAIVLYYEDPNGPMKLTPNWKGYVGFVWTEINAEGFHDRIYDRQPPAGTVRVAVIGDSYTMGDGVTLAESYPKQLEALLASGRPCEVMNCGVSASNSNNQLGTLRDVLADYHPHVVLLGFNVNDFCYASRTRFDELKRAGYSYTIHADQRVTVSREYTTSQRIRGELYNYSYLLRWLVNLKRNWEASRDPENAPGGVQAWMAVGGHQRSLEAIEEMHRLCQKEGVAFQVCIIPDLLSVAPSIRTMKDYPYKEQHALVAEHLGSRGIECLDLLPAFGDRTTRQLEAHRYNRHYNREGNELIAKALRPVVEERMAGVSMKPMPK